MTEIIFVTGTDTDVGKTVISSALLNAARRRSKKTLGLKPVAAGSDMVNGALRNEDALALIAASGTKIPYEKVNPVCVREAIAPHIALDRIGKHVSVSELTEHCREVISEDDELVLVEGAGGWFVPLNQTESLADFAVELGAKIVLVVGMKLGCLNHAFLTQAAISASGLQLAGWIANCATETMPFLDENLASLDRGLNAPCLGRVPHLDDPSHAVDFVDIEPLLPSD